MNYFKNISDIKKLHKRCLSTIASKKSIIQSVDESSENINLSELDKLDNKYNLYRMTKFGDGRYLFKKDYDGWTAIKFNKYTKFCHFYNSNKISNY